MFDVANPAHVSEVLRVFFSAEVVSCGIVLCEFDPRWLAMKVLEKDCAVYRPSVEHITSAAAAEVHGLGESDLGKGRDVSELYERLMGILERYPDVVIAAHNAQYDGNVLVESIENRVTDRTQRGDDADTETRLRGLRWELRDPRRWTCTWQWCVLQGSRVGRHRLANYRLATVFEAVTETPLGRPPQRAHGRARVRGDSVPVVRVRRPGGEARLLRRGIGHAWDASDVWDA